MYDLEVVYDQFEENETKHAVAICAPNIGGAVALKEKAL